MPRLRVGRVWCIADLGVNWRDPDTAIATMKEIKAARWNYVGFDAYDAKYLPSLRSQALKDEHARLLAYRGFFARVEAEAVKLKLGVVITLRTIGAIEEFARYASAVRVPLERTQDTAYWVALSRMRGGLRMYETASVIPEATVASVPIFVAPGHPSEMEDYKPYFASPFANRLGLALHRRDRDRFVKAVLGYAPVVSVPVRPNDYPQAPDAEIAVTVNNLSQWIEDVVRADATLAK